jgi:hypothetical protein
MRQDLRRKLPHSQKKVHFERRKQHHLVIELLAKFYHLAFFVAFINLLAA